MANNNFKNLVATCLFLILITTLHFNVYASQIPLALPNNSTSFINFSNLSPVQNNTYFPPSIKSIGNNISNIFNLTTEIEKKQEDSSCIVGKCGANLQYSFNKTTSKLTISGQGHMYNYNKSTLPPWSAYVSEIKSIEIEHGVTSIGSFAFSGCMPTLADTIQYKKSYIDAPLAHCYIFYGCQNLKSVVISDTVTFIGNAAFQNCHGLSSLVLPESVTFVGNDAFSGCTGLTSLTYFGNSDPCSTSKNCFLGCNNLNSVSVTNTYSSDKFANFPVSQIDNVSLAAIIKNEAVYIKEWIEFHKLVGVTRFYIYDNGSTDHLKETLKDYIDNGEVVYKYYPGVRVQNNAYQDAVNNFKYKTKYMGFIDIDEFVIPIEKENLVDAMDDIMQKNEKIGGVAINWLNYGSSNFTDKPAGLVTENYRYRTLNNHYRNTFIKSIVNPRKVRRATVHYSFMKNDYYFVNEDGEKRTDLQNYNCSYKKLRINHYFTKSKSEYLKKIERGDAARVRVRTMAEFYERDKNDVYDYVMEKYVNKLKEKFKA